MCRADRVILKLLGQRIALALLSLLAVSVVVFSITAVLPGDARRSSSGQDATPEAWWRVCAQMGLDVAGARALCKWLVLACSGGDPGLLGHHADAGGRPGSRAACPTRCCWRGRHRAVLGADCAGAGHRLGVCARLLVRPCRLRRRAEAVVSVPEFLVATLAVLVFAVKLRWLPALSFVSDIESLGQLLRAFAMPVLMLCCVDHRRR